MFYWGMLIGVFAGVWLGMCLMALCALAARGDEHIETIRKEDL